MGDRSGQGLGKRTGRRAGARETSSPEKPLWIDGGGSRADGRCDGFRESAGDSRGASLYTDWPFFSPIQGILDLSWCPPVFCGVARPGRFASFFGPHPTPTVTLVHRKSADTCPSFCCKSSAETCRSFFFVFCFVDKYCSKIDQLRVVINL